MKHFFLSTILFFALFNSALAQLPSMNKAKVLKIKDKILIVALEEENAAVIKKQDLKGADLKRYKDQIDGRNFALKSAFETFWKLNSSVQYMKYSEAVALMLKEKNKYVLARFDKPVDPTFSIKKTKNGVQIGWTSENNSFTYNSFTRQTHAVNKPLRLVFEMPKEVGFMYLPNFFPAKSDVVYAVKTFQYICSFMLESDKNNVGMLKNKKFDARNADLANVTLYVDKGDCNPPMTEIQVKKLYQYNLKTVFFEKIEETWTGNDDKIVILVPFIYEKKGKDKDAVKQRSNIIVNSATGKIYCIDCIKFKFGEYEDPEAERSFD